MKFLTSELLAALKQRDLKQNLVALYRYLLLLAGIIVAYSFVFHAVMLHEGQRHSWITGVYWTLTVMTTLGFGDITFHSDLGRGFTIVVMLTGVVMLLILLPFTFIRNFYAPWLDAQLKLKAPRELPEGTRGHVILCAYDAIAQAFVAHLVARAIPYVVLEPDPTRAVALHGEGVNVLVGYPDSVDTWRSARAERARLVVANLDDPANTNVTITLREHAPDVAIAAIVEDHDAIDILELAGATNVIALKRQLGQQLAARVGVGGRAAQVVGRYESLLVAELPARGTSLVGRTVRESRLRELYGVNVVACWERGRLVSAGPERVLDEGAVSVVIGAEAQLTRLDELLVDDPSVGGSVIVIGGGSVGRAAIRALSERGLEVAVIEKEARLESKLRALSDSVVIGDAASLDVMRRADIAHASAVLLTMHDDAANIFLAVYSSRLNPRCRIVSRVTHERNVESIHRAGADYALSQSGLAARLLVGVLLRRPLGLLDEAAELFVVEVPPRLFGRTLGESQIGARTGLNVIAIRRGEASESSPAATAVLTEGSSLVLLGTVDQRQELLRMLDED